MHINYGIQSLVSCETDNTTSQSALAETIERLLTELQVSLEADDALREILTILEMMRVLAVQATNDALTLRERELLQLELDELKDEIDRIVGEMRAK